MSWEKRGHGYYYYRKRRSGGRVDSFYVGRGEIADMAATLDAMQRAEDETGWMKEQRERYAFKSLDTSIDSLAKLASTLTDAILIADGFHQHKREWRKRRV